MNARSVPAASGARSIDCSWVMMRRVTNVLRPDVSVADMASGNRRSTKRARSALHHRVPVRQAADGGRLGKGRDETQPRMRMQQGFGRDEHAKAARQKQGSQSLHAPQFGGTNGVAGV